MIRKIISFCLLLFTACGDSNNPPNGVLNEDQMTELMLDVYVTEAKINLHSPRLPRDSAQLVFQIMKKDLLKENGVSDSVFEESMIWYFERPERLDAVYTRIMDSLNLKIQQQKPGDESNKD